MASGLLSYLRTSAMIGVVSFVFAGSAFADEQKVHDLVMEYEAAIERQKKVVSDLSKMVAVDQFYRWTMFEMIKKHNLSGNERRAFERGAGELIDEQDRVHVEKLKRLLKVYSWTELAVVKPNMAEAARTIVQHSGDLEFQKQTVKSIEPLVRAGLMEGSAYANMVDRIAKTSGEPQTYGTQTTCTEGELVAYEVAAPEGVNERRKELGLSSIEEYLAQLRQMYGEC